MQKTWIRLGLALMLLGVVVVAVLFHGTIGGLYTCHLSNWKEFSFKGRPLSELQNYLHTQNQTLEWCDPIHFDGITYRRLGANQRAMLFYKGDSYSWFHLGTAQNAGYVVIQNTTNGEVVVDVLRASFVDGP